MQIGLHRVILQPVSTFSFGASKQSTRAMMHRIFCPQRPMHKRLLYSWHPQSTRTECSQLIAYQHHLARMLATARDCSEAAAVASRHHNSRSSNRRKSVSHCSQYHCMQAFTQFLVTFFICNFARCRLIFKKFFQNKLSSKFVMKQWLKIPTTPK